MIKINSFSEELYQQLKYYIESNSLFNPKVLKNVKENQYPLVVFETNSNIKGFETREKQIQMRKLSFEISIFAITMNENDSSVICDELAQLVTEVMQGYYNMQGGLDAKLKNINVSKATKYVMHFTCDWYMQKNIVY